MIRGESIKNRRETMRKLMLLAIVAATTLVLSKTASADSYSYNVWIGACDDSLCCESCTGPCFGILADLPPFNGMTCVCSCQCSTDRIASLQP